MLHGIGDDDLPQVRAAMERMLTDRIDGFGNCHRLQRGEAPHPIDGLERVSREDHVSHGGVCRIMIITIYVNKQRIVCRWASNYDFL